MRSRSVLTVFLLVVSAPLALCICPAPPSIMSAPKEVHEDELVDYDEDAAAQTLEPAKPAPAQAAKVTR